MSPEPKRPLLSALLAAVAAFLIACAFCVGQGLWRASLDIADQGYAHLGFERNRAIVLAQGTRSGLERAIEWAFDTDEWFTLGFAWHAAWIVFVFAFVFVAWIAPRPERATALLRDRRGLPWLLLFWLVVALLPVLRITWLVGGPTGGASRGDLVWALMTAGLGALVTLVLWRVVKRASEPVPVTLQASVIAAFAALAPLLIAGFWLDRRMLAWFPNRRLHTPGFEPQHLVWNALLVVAGAIVFWIVRRAVRVQASGGSGLRALGPLFGLGLAAGVGVAIPLAMERASASAANPRLTAERPLNVLLIGIDTLRGDFTSIFGPGPEGRDLTPNLRALASHGVAFRSAIAQAPWTMPSFSSILTGKYPHEHGAYSLAGFLRRREVTLAEVLREAGYQTRCVVSHSYVDTKHGFNQGFDEFDQQLSADGHTHLKSSATQVTDRAIGWLDSAAKDAPLFVFAHYFDPHYEYLDHSEFPWADGYKGWLKSQLSFDNLMRNRNLLEDAELEFLKARYSEEIAHTDREVGRLLEHLAQSGRAKDTLVLVVADHGEAFMDHGNFGHTIALEDELVRVPLIVAVPGATASVRNDTVETRNVFGTVLDALGIDFDPQARERSFLRAPPETGAGAFSCVWLPDANPDWGKKFQLASLRDDHHKLVIDITRRVERLYDLDLDPGEKVDASAKEPEVLAAMRARLLPWIEEMNHGVAPTQAMTPDEIENLRNLGYVGGGEEK